MHHFVDLFRILLSNVAFSIREMYEISPSNCRLATFAQYSNFWWIGSEIEWIRIMDKHFIHSSSNGWIVWSPFNGSFFSVFILLSADGFDLKGLNCSDILFVLSEVSFAYHQKIWFSSRFSSFTIHKCFIFLSVQPDVCIMGHGAQRIKANCHSINRFLEFGRKMGKFSKFLTPWKFSSFQIISIQTNTRVSIDRFYF